MRERPDTHSASLTQLTEDDLEDFTLENSPSIRNTIARAKEDIKAGKIVSLDDYLTGAK